MTKLKFPVLCVHDSFIVPSPLEESLRYLMKEAFKYAIEKVDLPSLSATLKTKSIGLSGDILDRIINYRKSGHPGGEGFKKSLLGFSRIDEEYEARHIAHTRRFPFTDGSHLAF